MPEYNFKFAAELGWAALTGLLIVGVELAMEFEPETIQEWDTWAVASVGAAVRGIGGAVAAYLGRKGVESIG